MTLDELNAHLRSLPDGELLWRLKVAAKDLNEAIDGADEEWRSACLAATLAYSQETNRRGLRALDLDPTPQAAVKEE